MDSVHWPLHVSLCAEMYVEPIADQPGPSVPAIAGFEYHVGIFSDWTQSASRGAEKVKSFLV